MAQIYQANGALDSAKGRFDYGRGGPGEGDDTAVVVGVHLAVEDGDAAHGAGRFGGGVLLGSRVDFGGVAAFGEVGDALDKLGAGCWVLGAGVRQSGIPRFIVAWTLFAPK